MKIKDIKIKDLVLVFVVLFISNAYAQVPIGGGDGGGGNGGCQYTIYYRDSDGDGYGDTGFSICRNGLLSGYTVVGGDCADNNAAIHPNTVWYRDGDGDGFGIASSTRRGCVRPSGYVSNTRDCNDSNGALHPNTVWYRDSDNDSWGNPGVTKKQCTRPSGYVSNNKDHNDGTNLITNIAPRNFYRDADGDTFGNPNVKTYRSVRPSGYVTDNRDCYDSDATIHPNTVWYFDGDSDGWGSDQGIGDFGNNQPPTKIQCIQPIGYAIKKGDLNDGNEFINNIPPKDFFIDKDRDGYGAKGSGLFRSFPPDDGNTYVLVSGDCDDTKIEIHPNTVWYKDGDGDTFGDPNITKQQCHKPAGYIFRAGDISDSDEFITNIPPRNFYRDREGDGFGDPNDSVYHSVQPTGYVDNAEDQCPDEFGMNQGCLSSQENYVFTRVYQKPVTSSQGTDVIESISFFDGLGRSKQEVAIKASPNQKDIVTHITYDAYGRQAKQYLPFERQQAYPGSYTTVDVTHDINSYYKNIYADDFTGIAVADINAYSEMVYEASPLNRVLEQGAPGEAWKVDLNSDSDHTIKFEYSANTTTEGIPYFTVSFADSNTTEVPTLTKVRNYVTGELYVTITKDENWKPTDGDLHTTKEYKNKQGQVVLKRTYATIPTPIEGGATVATVQEHDTYYVYDSFGNLTYVIPPKVTITDDVSDTELTELCYQYRYDHRNRLIEKKIPGKDWEYIIYNRLDQPVLTQDANLRAKRRWLFTKYDAFGRVAYTGIIENGSTVALLRKKTGGTSYATYESRSTTPITIAGATLYYTNDSYPVRMYKILTVNYYDDYNLGDLVSPNPNTTAISWEGMTATAEVKGLPTVSQVRVLDTNKWITTATYYDEKGRPWETIVKNEYLGTDDYVLNKLDFVGKVLKSNAIHIKGGTTITTVDTFTYDHMGRLVTQTQKINNQEEERIVSNAYDALGQLITKEVGGGLQEVDYNYNVRGWLQNINADSKNDNDLFNFSLSYANPQHGAIALFNGNISETTWQTANDNVERYYTYGYDALNRITAATSNDSRYNLSGVTYDKMGNILGLSRNGFQNTDVFTNMDILSYEYGSGNKLQKVTDGGNDNYGFKDGTNTNDDFTYDDNGNMIIDRNKGISSISYNHLNLPTTIAISNTSGNGNITYIYDATGAKQKKIVAEGSSLIETEYAGNYIYKNGVLQFINHPEGYVEPSSSSLSGAESYDYVYQLKDHLGNIRLSFSDKDGDGKIDVLRNNTDVDGDSDNAHEILQEKNYYPFGLEHKGYNNTITGREHQWKYNGKEHEEELGLNMYDYGARNYDPAIGRWWQIDPLAEQMRRFSPYNFGWNNPIYFIDPDGMFAQPFGDFINENGKKIGSDGIDDGKVYVVKTTQKSFDSKVASNGISKKQAKATEKFIKENSGNTSAFQKNSIAYDNSVEIEGSAETRQAMVDIVNQDNGRGGTSDANNREYGGTVSNDGSVTQSPPGEVADPSVHSSASITHTITGSTKSTFHSHPSGDKVEGTGANRNSSASSSTTLGGSTKTSSFAHAPSAPDVNGSTRTNYVFSRGNGRVYIYSGGGVIATVPQKRFVTPKE